MSAEGAALREIAWCRTFGAHSYSITPSRPYGRAYFLPVLRTSSLDFPLAA
jgi:hypothetical protein